MKVLFLCGGGEGTYSSSQAFIHALKTLGHAVWSAGRGYYGRCLTDVELPHREHVEYYSFLEVLYRCPWTPDLAICFDPGGYFYGEKPKGLKSILISTDAHRNGAMLREVIKNGSYDLFCNLQPNYSHFFTDLVKVHTTIPAFDDRRFKIDVDTEPVCDISFCGQTGLALREGHWNSPDGQDEVGKYISNLKGRLFNSLQKYEFAFLPSYDYAERGELLYRLSQDFDLRIYETLWNEKLQLALQKGKVGFNCSILNDVSLRNYEVAASGRPLVTDDVGGKRRIFDILATTVYPTASHLYRAASYRPFYSNFSLTYGEVKKRIEFALDSRNLKEARDNRGHVFLTHTWQCRAKEILRAIEVSNG